MSLFERLKDDCRAEWSAYVGHAFVRGLGDGTLPEAAFRRYLVQDYLFLIQFARAYALAVYKGRDLDEMRDGLEGLKAIMDVEMGLHVRLSARWGLTAADLEGADEASETVAYTRFVLDAGMSGDLLDLWVALAPCMIGYGEIGRALAPASADNPFRDWIEEYASDGYQDVARASRERIDRLAPSGMGADRYGHLRRLFATATRLEAAFWQMGLDATVNEERTT